MFNTFGGESNDLTLAKKERIQMKQRLIELNNLSTIQLNPWNDDNSKSPLYLENQAFPSFPKPCLKNSAVIKYAIPRQEAKKQDNKIAIDRRRTDPKNLLKKQMDANRGRKRLISDNSQLQRMNKTISVNNFEGEKMFERKKSNENKQKVLEKEEKRHRTTINNPMYGKFCINYNVQKQSVHQRKRVANDCNPAKFNNLSMKEIVKFRSRMSTLSMDRGDPERAKSIHEVRRRLKSTSEIMRRKEENEQSYAQLTSSRVDKQIYIQIQRDKRSQNRFKFVNMSHLKAISPSIESRVLHSSQSGEKFKLGRRKNLYIGFRKFFNQGVNMKQRNLQITQSVPRDIVNLDALMERGEGNSTKKFQKFELFAFQKSLSRNDH